MSDKLKFGICCWNFWGDSVIDRPDNTDEMVVAHVVEWLIRHGLCERVYQLQHMEGLNPTFTAEASSLRKFAYERIIDVPDIYNRSIDEYPDLDIIFCRWRWDVGTPGDVRLKKQDEMFARYGGTKTRILVWDEDYMLTQADLGQLSVMGNVDLIETSSAALKRDLDGLAHDRTYVPHPLKLELQPCLDAVLPPAGSGKGDHLDTNMFMAYVGNNYKREQYLKKYFSTTCELKPGRIHLYGNWTKYDTRVVREHPGITFHPKVGRAMRDWAYQHAACVPMLAKEEYFRLGHITPRLHEVVNAGSIPIGFSEFNGWDRYYLPDTLAWDADSLYDVAIRCSNMTYDQRKAKLKEQVELLLDNRIFDVDLFFENIGVSK